MNAPHPAQGVAPLSLPDLAAVSRTEGGREMEPAMRLALQANFGSEARWRQAFLALCQARGGGTGWALLLFRPRHGTLAHLWVPGPAALPDDGVPLLALGTGGGARAERDVEGFMAQIDWAAVYARYQRAVHDATDALGTTAEAMRDSTVLDVRRAGVFEKATAMLPGARWCDPADVERWGAGLGGSGPVVVYCVYGHEVGRATALRLRAAGVDARYLQGGIDGWQAAGRPVVARGAA